MLKILLVFALVLPIFPMQANAQTTEAQQTSKGDKPSLTTAPVVPQDCPGAHVQPQHQEHVQADVRVISTPEKDAYDRAAVWINLILALIGAFGIGAAFITLRKLERQTKATEGAVSEAKASRTLAENTAKRQLRAYLCIETACVKITENIVINGQSGTLLEGQLYVKNGGQTPAYDVRTWVHGSIRPYPESTPVPKPPDGLPKGIAIVPPRAEPNPLCAKWIAITPQAVESLKSPDTAYYVQAEVHYRDIFKDWHCLKVRMLFGGPAGTRTKKDTNGVTLGFLVPDSWGNSEEDESDPDGPQKPN